jgi:hypothetical protein
MQGEALGESRRSGVSRESRILQVSLARVEGQRSRAS